MFISKKSKASTVGQPAYIYSNTSQTHNTPVIAVATGSDTNHLPPNLTTPPSSPDTISPTTTLSSPPPNLLLPVGGVNGKVYVILTKATPSAAVVVVEATNDYMVFDKSVDTNYFGKKLKDITEGEENEEEPVWTPDEKYVLDTVVKYALDALNYCAYNLTGFNSPEITNAFKGRIEREPKVNAFVKYVVDNLLDAAGTYYSTNKTTTYDMFANLDYSSPTIELMAFIGVDPVVSFGVFPRINPVTEAYLNTYKTNRTSIIRVNFFVAINYLGFKFEQIGAWLGILCGLTVTIKLHYPGSCYPLADTTQPLDVDNITVEALTGELEIVPPPDEPPLPENEYKGYVRRGYVNIGGKLKYLYSVDITQETTVYLNYDGSNYGCKLIITAPQETAQTVNITTASLAPNASFTNNLSPINAALNTTQQAALQACLPIPDDILKGGFDSSIGAFKSYGFASIFYKSRTPVAYNDTIIKACAVYGI
jgi:hypothetical protein